MKISVCTVTARKGFLPIQAQMLSEQQYSDELEWIIVDAAYEANKESLQNVDSNDLKIIHEPNVRNDIQFFRDITRNRNKALALATGDAVIFLDDYACIEPMFVQEHVNILLKNQISVGNMFRLPKIDTKYNHPEEIVQSSFGKVDVMLTKYADIMGQDFRLRQNNFYNVVGDTYTGNLGIPRMVFEQLNGFDPRMESALEDCDFGIRANMAGFAAIFNPLAYTINMATENLPYAKVYDHAHDVEPFICNGNNNFAGNAKLKENKHMHIHFHTGYRVAECKTCGATGMIDPNELITYKKSLNQFQIPPNLPGGLDTF